MSTLEALWGETTVLLKKYQHWKDLNDKFTISLTTFSDDAEKRRESKIVFTSYGKYGLFVIW